MSPPYPLRAVQALRRQVDLLESRPKAQLTPTHVLVLLGELPGFCADMGVPDTVSGHMRGVTAGAMVLWRKTQFIYSFDGDLFDAIVDTDGVDDVPADLLRRMPAQATWIDVPSRNVSYLLTLDAAEAEDGSDAASDLWISVFADYGTAPDPVCHRFKLDGCVSKSISSVFEDLSPVLSEVLIQTFTPAVACALYLCSEEPDVVGAMNSLNKKCLQRSGRPGGPTICEVGYREGAEFRKDKAEYEREVRDAEAQAPGSGSRIPHWRKMHRHHYWVGARDSPDRRRILKWLKPIRVNAKPGDEIPAVVRRVRKEKI